MFDWFGWFDSEKLAHAKSKKETYKSLLDDVKKKEKTIKTYVLLDDISLTNDTHLSDAIEPEKTTRSKMDGIFTYATNLRSKATTNMETIGTLKAELSTKVTYWEDEITKIKDEEEKAKEAERKKQEEKRNGK